MSDGCKLCPRLCGANRAAGEVGFCGADGTLRVARAAPHFWEEPPISGERGSGTVFFSHCPLRCVYCQNRNISSGGFGVDITVERLCDIFFELAECGVHNINLVSPTQYTKEIIAAVRMAKARGFSLPFVWNTGGYERAETLRALEGLVDIYLTDYKYASGELAARYSAAADYPAVAEAALREMVRQQPACVYDSDGELLTRGVIVRHLVLPTHADDSCKVVRRVFDAYGDRVILSLMSQYTPVGDCGGFAELASPVSTDEYDRVVDFARSLDVENAFIQEGGCVSESFIPAFDTTGVLPEKKENRK